MEGGREDDEKPHAAHPQMEARQRPTASAGQAEKRNEGTTVQQIEQAAASPMQASQTITKASQQPACKQHGEDSAGSTEQPAAQMSETAAEAPTCKADEGREKPLHAAANLTAEAAASPQKASQQNLCQISHDRKASTGPSICSSTGLSSMPEQTEPEQAADIQKAVDPTKKDCPAAQATDASKQAWPAAEAAQQTPGIKQEERAIAEQDKPAQQIPAISMEGDALPQLPQQDKPPAEAAQQTAAITVQGDALLQQDKPPAEAAQQMAAITMEGDALPKLPQQDKAPAAEAQQIPAITMEGLAQQDKAPAAEAQQIPAITMEGDALPQPPPAAEAQQIAAITMEGHALSQLPQQDKPPAESAQQMAVITVEGDTARKQDRLATEAGTPVPQSKPDSEASKQEQPSHQAAPCSTNIQQHGDATESDDDSILNTSIEEMHAKLFAKPAATAAALTASGNLPDHTAAEATKPLSDAASPSKEQDRLKQAQTAAEAAAAVARNLGKPASWGGIADFVTAEEQGKTGQQHDDEEEDAEQPKPQAKKKASPKSKAKAKAEGKAKAKGQAKAKTAAKATTKAPAKTKATAKPDREHSTARKRKSNMQQSQDEQEAPASCGKQTGKQGRKANLEPPQQEQPEDAQQEQKEAATSDPSVPRKPGKAAKSQAKPKQQGGRKQKQNKADNVQKSDEPEKSKKRTLSPNTKQRNSRKSSAYHCEFNRLRNLGHSKEEAREGARKALGSKSCGV